MRAWTGASATTYDNALVKFSSDAITLTVKDPCIDVSDNVADPKTTIGNETDNDE